MEVEIILPGESYTSPNSQLSSSIDSLSSILDSLQTLQDEDLRSIAFFDEEVRGYILIKCPNSSISTSNSSINNDTEVSNITETTNTSCNNEDNIIIPADFKNINILIQSLVVSDIYNDNNDQFSRSNDDETISVSSKNSKQHSINKDKSYKNRIKNVNGSHSVNTIKLQEKDYIGCFKNDNKKIQDNDNSESANDQQEEGENDEDKNNNFFNSESSSIFIWKFIIPVKSPKKMSANPKLKISVEIHSNEIIKKPESKFEFGSSEIALKDNEASLNTIIESNTLGEGEDEEDDDGDDSSILHLSKPLDHPDVFESLKETLSLKDPIRNDLTSKEENKETDAVASNSIDAINEDEEDPYELENLTFITSYDLFLPIFPIFQMRLKSTKAFGRSRPKSPLLVTLELGASRFFKKYSVPMMIHSIKLFVPNCEIDDLFLSDVIQFPFKFDPTTTLNLTYQLKSTEETASVRPAVVNISSVLKNKFDEDVDEEDNDFKANENKDFTSALEIGKEITTQWTTNVDFSISHFIPPSSARNSSTNLLNYGMSPGLKVSNGQYLSRSSPNLSGNRKSSSTTMLASNSSQIYSITSSNSNSTLASSPFPKPMRNVSNSNFKRSQSSGTILHLSNGNQMNLSETPTISISPDSPQQEIPNQRYYTHQNNGMTPIMGSPRTPDMSVSPKHHNNGANRPISPVSSTYSRSNTAMTNINKGNIRISFSGPTNVKAGEVFKWKVQIINNTSDLTLSLFMFLQSAISHEFEKTVPPVPAPVNPNAIDRDDLVPIYPINSLIRSYKASKFSSAHANGLLCLSNNVKIRQLEPKSVYDGEIELVGLEKGIFSLHEVKLAELNSGETFDCGRLLDVLVV
ncbi:hypothetical protein B5S31_g3984 [[Candida] boidinii]|nr:hypothetical protein B5S31_g3984 [[Candida] boidinii]OWB80244.1 hypothetical protein B5S32_g4504 [[Candida] boidinii]